MSSIRKITTLIEDELIESGVPVDSPYRKVAVAAAVKNPYAGRHSDDLKDIVEASVDLVRHLATVLVDTMGSPVLGYGKASLVGMNGEVEHGHAYLTTPAADQLRAAIGGGKAWISSTGKRGAPGTTLDIPLAHKDALKVRAFYDTITVGVPDAPEPDEVLVVIAGVNRGRPNFRLGGLSVDEIIGEDGLH